MTSIPPSPATCSFCGVTDTGSGDDILMMLAPNGAAICSDCLEIGAHLFADHRRNRAAARMGFDKRGDA